MFYGAFAKTFELARKLKGDIKDKYQTTETPLVKSIKYLYNN